MHPGVVIIVAIGKIEMYGHLNPKWDSKIDKLATLIDRSLYGLDSVLKTFRRPWHIHTSLISNKTEKGSASLENSIF